MNNSNAIKPSDIIIKFLEEIVELWDKGQYQKVTERCEALLKRKKTIDNLRLTVPLQRVLLQAWLHQEQYDKILEWESSTKSTHVSLSSNQQTGSCKDLVLYARYRSKNYESSSKQSAVIANDDGGDDDDEFDISVYQHLFAQSEFHLHRTRDALTMYKDLLSNLNDNEIDSKTEVLTNALAVIASSACTPMVNLGSKDIDCNDDGASYNFFMDEAQSMLFQYDDNADLIVDLASNLGCIQFLTDPTITNDNWLNVAVAASSSQKKDGSYKTGEVEETNSQWCKHFWYKDVEDVRYEIVSPSKNNSTKLNQISVPQSIARVNQSLLDENLSRLPQQPHQNWNLLQVRMYWYNRAILQLRAGKYVECHDSCQSLKKTLASSSGIGGKNRKKDNKFGSINDNSNNSKNNYPTSSTKLWWESRADVILAHAQQAQSKYKEASSRLKETLSKVRMEVDSSSTMQSLVTDHAVAHIQLNLYVLEQRQQENSGKKGKQQQQQKLLKVLKSLPESIQDRPAVKLTIDNLEEITVDTSNGDGNKSRNIPKNAIEEADFLFGQGQYEKSCNLYESALSTCADDNSPITDSKLRYIQALAIIGQHEASQALWHDLERTLLQEDDTSMKRSTASFSDGAVLENKSLPRTANRSSSISKELEANKTTIADNQNDDADKPSHEKILRYRARKREKYLKELEKKGQYNPDRPTKPDPERWIPKYDRSRFRRGGRNNNNGNNRSAQGGGSNLDAQRLGLDAAARRAGKVPASSGPSTATMKVSSGGRKGGRRR